jgi:FimV-like protein
LAGLSLDLPTDLPADNGNFPFVPQAIDPVLQVRLDLAQALWEAGQTQTARLLAEEVAEQARGQLQSMAREWLTSHA